MSETVFKQVNYDLNSLIKYIELGEIGLPDIQRPFVWKTPKCGTSSIPCTRLPVGYLLFWQNEFSDDARVIGTDKNKNPPTFDRGRTATVNVHLCRVERIPVVRENYESELIDIAFNPLLGKFEVADAAIRRDKSYIPDISILWSNDTTCSRLLNGILPN